ncbi:DUF1330 domain-containing protein [Roseomonas sp. BN140053]|uniref:DUF1330 domain-containing protein n=1 Tax=Roseomonas sp. BN140053 TaxID=3391898 RepID=UPI0039ECA34D
MVDASGSERRVTAYMLVQGTITDEEQYGRYREAVMPLIATFGGKHVRGGTVELLEGQHDERRTALFEFPSLEAIHAFWNSPEYGPVKELRRGAADLQIWAIPGL